MLLNGNFESGSFSPGWTVSQPNGACSGLAGQISTVFPHTGTYSIRDGCNGRSDRISQSFAATLGQTYVVSFWLRTSGGGTTMTINVNLG